MRIQKITCVQLGGDFPDFCHRLIMPDYGMPLIGTILAEAGYDTEVYVEHVSPPEWSRLAESDVVCFSTLSAGAGKTYRLAQRVRSELGVPTILGGTHATYYAEDCLDFVDYVVLGEGDETILALLQTLAEGGDIGEVPGIAYRSGDTIVRTPLPPGPKRFETIPDFSLIHGYPKMSALDVLLNRKKPLITAQSSRGCPFKCTFCIVNTMFPDGYRKRDIETVIADLRDKRKYGRELMFVDNEFATQRPYTKQLLRRIIEEDLGFEFVVFMRVEHAADDELLALMAEAGVTQVYQGYESVQPQTLDSYKKRQSVDQIVMAIGKLQLHGFHILGSFVVGADTDTLETLDRTVDFVLEHKLSNAYFFPIWGHYPEALNGFQTIVPWYRSIFRGWEYCDGNFVTHFPLQMRPSDLQLALIKAHRAVYSPAQVLDSLRRKSLSEAKKRALHRYVWRGIEKGLFEHVGFLQRLEAGLYDDDGVLREDRLAERVRADGGWAFRAGNRAAANQGLSPLEMPLPGRRNITCLPPTRSNTDSVSAGRADGLPIAH